MTYLAPSAGITLYNYLSVCYTAVLVLSRNAPSTENGCVADYYLSGAKIILYYVALVFPNFSYSTVQKICTVFFVLCPPKNSTKSHQKISSKRSFWFTVIAFLT